MLVVSSPDGTRDTITMSDKATQAALYKELPAGFRPLAVGFEMSEREFACICVAATPRGPKRVPLSVGAALTLVRAGVHGIVTSRSADSPPRAEVSHAQTH